MRKFTSTLFVLGLSFAGYAQTGEEKAVSDAVETLRKALIDADKKALAEITSSGLSYGHSNGKIEDQAAFIERLVTGDSDFKTITLSDQTLKIVGNTAIVRHKLSAETADKGVPGNANLHVLLIWQKQKGKWKLLARQATRL